MGRLTERQMSVIRTIVSFFQREERPPTTRELAQDLKCHVKTVYQHLLALERKGAISRRKGRIHVADRFRSDRGIPIVGHIAAGTPILAEEHIEGVLSLYKEFRGPGDLFALEVHGESMIGAHICDGDHVIVHKQPSVENGEIGVALIDDEATVKRIFVSNGCIRLVPENPMYEESRFDGTCCLSVQILGKVVGVFRRLK
jgi:repressor LexA